MIKCGHPDCYRVILQHHADNQDSPMHVQAVFTLQGVISKFEFSTPLRYDSVIKLVEATLTVFKADKPSRSTL